MQKPFRDKQLASIEQIVKLEKEVSQVQTQYKDAEENYGSDVLNLVVDKGYLTKLLGNDAIKRHITRHEPEILEYFELVVNTVSNSNWRSMASLRNRPRTMHRRNMTDSLPRRNAEGQNVYNLQ